jgi:uncharacterized protein YdhG (YjbR/CyaY superfamily)
MFDDYLSGLEEEDRRVLRLLVDHVRQVAPQATEGRSYGLPAFRYRGKPLLGFAAAKKHLSLYPFSPSVLDSVKDRLVGFELSKGTARFTVDHPIPHDVVTRMVHERIAEIDGR